MNYKLIFIGTGEFAVSIFEKLIASEFKPVVVITQPDKPKGRRKVMTPSPVKIAALEQNISLMQPKNLKELDVIKAIRAINPDIAVVADYGQIIPKEILNIPKFGVLNVHPSLLPKYRGPSPIQYTILNNDSETGVTIILMDEKIDHGPIIKNKKLKIKNKKLIYSELMQDLANLGGELLVETLPQWLGNEIKSVPQDDTQATYTKLLTREDGKINWQKTAEEIERQIRAFEQWPESWCEWIKNGKGLRLKITKVRILHPTTGWAENPTPGFIFLTEQKELAVNCKPGSLIIEELQLEGKNKMKGKEFLHGFSEIIGTVLK